MKILVTGSDGCIARTLIRRLANDGHLIWGASRKLTQKQFLSGSTECDLADYRQADHLAETLRTAGWGTLDGLIHCTTTNISLPAVEMNPEDWSRTINDNLNAAFFTIRAIYPLLVTQSSADRAKVICFSGRGGESAKSNYAAYGASKAAIIRLTETLAHEWANVPIDINCVSPGGFMLSDGTLIPRPPGNDSFDKLFNLVSFLLSPKSNHFSGNLIFAQKDSWTSLMNTRASRDPDCYKLRRISPKGSSTSLLMGLKKSLRTIFVNNR